MKIEVKYMQQILYLISFILIVPKSIELFTISMKKDAIIMQMIANKTLLENTVDDCEIVSSIKKINPIYDENDEFDSSIDEYWKYKNEIQTLNHKLMVLCTHNSMVINKYRILQDKITNTVYLGSYNYPFVPCDAETIKINGKTRVYKPNQIVKVSRNDNLEIEYNRYQFNSSYAKIDTIRTRRYIDKNTLYNKPRPRS